MDDKKIEIDLKKLADDLGAEVEDIHMLFVEYCNEMKDEMEELRKELAKEDWNMMQRTAHNIKGVSINLGIMEMHRQAEKIDLMMKNSVHEGIEAEIALMVNTFSKTEKAIYEAFELHGIKI